MFTALFAWFLVQQSSLGSNRRFSEWFPPLDLAIYKKAGLVLDRGGHLYDRVVLPRPRFYLHPVCWLDL